MGWPQVSTWKTKKLGILADVKGGKRLPKGENVVSDKTNHPYIRLTDMIDGKINAKNVMYITDEVHKKISRYTISKEDIYLSIAGTIGVVCRVPEELDGANLTENAVKISLKSKEIIKDYLFYFLNSHDGQTQIKQRTGGASQPKLALDRVKSIEVHYPDPEFQLKITSQLNVFNQAIDHLSARIDILQELALIELRTFLDENGSAEHTKPLGHIADLISVKFTEGRDDQLPLVDMASITTSQLAISSVKASSDLKSSRILFEPGDILFGSIRCYLHKVALAPFRGVTNVSIFVLRPRKEVYRSFLTILLFAKSTIEWASRNSNGTKMPTINWEVFSTMPIQVPSITSLEVFAKRVDSLINQIQVLTKMRLNLREQQILSSSVFMSEGYL